MSRVVTCVAFGGGYARGMVRLEKSLVDVGWVGMVKAWATLPPGAAAPNRFPYEFKVRALEIAQSEGHTAALWADSSVWFLKNPDPIFERIERDGHYFFSEGWNVGQWCTDAGLRIMELSREEAFTIPSISAIMYGLDLSSEIGREVLNKQRAYCDAGAFFGDWNNDHGQVSANPDVLGHRHDQTCLSVIIHRMGLTLEVPSVFFQRKAPDVEVPPQFLATAAGM